MSCLSFLKTHCHTFFTHLYQHIAISFIAILSATCIGVPLGILILCKPRLKKWVLGINNTFQTVPSLALLALLIPILGIGIKPTILILIVYALMPITRNTLTGLEQVPEVSITAAIGLGFTRWQRLYLVELPLALPTIIAGIRTATAMTIGITTIAAFVGAGGLGEFITEGLALNSTPLILLGAIPVAILALVFDAIISQLENLVSQRKKSVGVKRVFKHLMVWVFVPTLCFITLMQFLPEFLKRRQPTITIASKNFTEQYILGNMMAELIQHKTHLKVIKKFNLGTTAFVQQAMLKKQVDLYPEYTGTAYMDVLHRKKVLSANKTYQLVKSAYQKKFYISWLAPFGFYNTQTLAVKNAFAKKFHLKTLENLARISNKISIAAPPEFIKRPDALPALKKSYHFHFKKIVGLQSDLLYQAINNNNVDVILAFTTDPRTQLYHLTLLKDNHHIAPPYYAAPVIRSAVLKKYPKLQSVLAKLAGIINNHVMRQLNEQVNIQHESPAVVAHRFLVKKKLI